MTNDFMVTHRTSEEPTAFDVKILALFSLTSLCRMSHSWRSRTGPPCHRKLLADRLPESAALQI